jgi:apolipoprotein N-acyltransferase
MSQLRAVENGRTVAQVATTGKSAVIGADGTIIAESHALYTADAIIATVPLRTSSTLATRLGTLPECFLAGLALAGIGWAVAGELIRRRTRRRAELPAPPARTDHPVIDDQSKEAATT